MVRVAVSIARVPAINFCFIYPGDPIFPGFYPLRSYPHFSAVRFVGDYLTDTIKNSKIAED
jgi:hypothetical protein